MRPVFKWEHTDLTIDPPIHAIYNPYGNAKVDLERNIGAYCSYCERPAQDEAVHVEHVQPKSLPENAHLVYAWSNFLLSCCRCNGSDNKGNKEVVINQVHLPHLNNIYISFVYLEGGFVKLNENLTGIAFNNAVSLLDLVGLDKRPGHKYHLSKDRRWDRRRVAWEIATKTLNKFNAGVIDTDSVVDLAKGYGFWSVWYTVFNCCTDVKSALICNFRGTAANCFDAANSFQPVPRNPANSDDTT